VWYGSTRVAGSHTIHPLYVFPIASPQLCLLRVVDNLEAQASRDSANSANYLPRHAQAAPGLDRKRNHASRKEILIAASTPRAAAITELEKKFFQGKENIILFSSSKFCCRQSIGEAAIRPSYLSAWTLEI